MDLILLTRPKMGLLLLMLLCGFTAAGPAARLNSEAKSVGNLANAALPSSDATSVGNVVSSTPSASKVRSSGNVAPAVRPGSIAKSTGHVAPAPKANSVGDVSSALASSKAKSTIKNVHAAPLPPPSKAKSAPASGSDCPCGIVTVVFDKQDPKQVFSVKRETCTGSKKFLTELSLTSTDYCYFTTHFGTCTDEICSTYQGRYIKQIFNDASIRTDFRQNKSHLVDVPTGSLAIVHARCKIQDGSCSTFFTKGLVGFVNGSWYGKNGDPLSITDGNKRKLFDDLKTFYKEMKGVYATAVPRSRPSDYKFSSQVAQLIQVEATTTSPRTTTSLGPSVTHGNQSAGALQEGTSSQDWETKDSDPYDFNYSSWIVTAVCIALAIAALTLSGFYIRLCLKRRKEGTSTTKCNHKSVLDGYKERIKEHQQADKDNNKDKSDLRAENTRLKNELDRALKDDQKKDQVKVNRAVRQKDIEKVAEKRELERKHIDDLKDKDDEIGRLNREIRDCYAQNAEMANEIAELKEQLQQAQEAIPAAEGSVAAEDTNTSTPKKSSIVPK